MANLKYKDNTTGQWISLSTIRGPKGDNADITLNGNTSLNASFYAPVNSGTSGQMLVSRGSGEAPQWTAQPIMTPVYNATLSIKKNNTTVGTFTANASQDANVNIEVPTNSDILNLIYPINSIYVTLNSTNPDILFPGTHWEQIQDKFLLSAGSSYNAGNTGGNSTHVHTTQNHKLTSSEVPKHSHTRGTMEITGSMTDLRWNNSVGLYSMSTTGAFTRVSSYPSGRVTAEDTYWGSGSDSACLLGFKASNNWTGSTSESGGDGNHNHGDTTSSSSMPPYLVVYMWKRIS